MSEDPRAETALQPWATPPALLGVPEGTTGPPSRAVVSAGGSAPLAPTPGPGGGPVSGFIKTVPPVLQVKPPSGVDFAPTGVLAGASIATTTPAAQVTGCVFLVPDGSVAYLRSFDLQVNALLGTSAITFSVMIDGAAVPGLDALGVVPAPLAVWIKSFGPDEIFLVVPGGKTLEIRVQVADGGNYVVGASMHGWTVAQATASAFDAGWS